MFGQPPSQVRAPRNTSDDCKIKIRKTRDGEIIEFKGKCTREQIEMAKTMRNVESEPSRSKEDFDDD